MEEVWCPRRGDLFAVCEGRYPSEEEIRVHRLGNTPGPDHWERDRFERAEGRDYVRWNWPWVPRTCSYCGGVHPEDAIQLIGEGWECESTDKEYKRYLNPPGSALAFARQMLWFRDRDATLAADQAPAERPEELAGAWSPTPPLKLYVPHFGAEQISRFNAALARSREERKNDADTD